MYRASITRLFGEACRHAKQFAGEEFELAKAELSEKAVKYRRAATRAGTGAFIIYGALIVLLTGLGFLFAYLFQSIGLDPMPARGAGFGGVGLLVVVAGSVLVWKSVRRLSSDSVTPEKTLYTLRRIMRVTPETVGRSMEPAAPRHSSKDLHAQVVATERRLGKNLESLSARVSPARYLRAASARVRANPVRWNLAALATGFAGSLWFVKKLRK
jgi:hypothetical protein